MNKEIKVAVGLLICLVGLIVYMEMTGKKEAEVDKTMTTDATVTPQPMATGTETISTTMPDTTGKDPLKTEVLPGQDMSAISSTTSATAGSLAQNNSAGLGQDPDLTITEGAASTEILSSAGEKATTSSGYDPNREIPKTYVIKKGDVLSKVAHTILGKASYTKLILEKNPELDPDHIVPGMELTMPTKEELDDRPTKAATAHANNLGDKSYRVKKGDSLYSISRNVLGSPAKVKEIIDLNPELDPNNLQVGQTLVLPPQ